MTVYGLSFFVFFCWFVATVNTCEACVGRFINPVTDSLLDMPLSSACHRQKGCQRGARLQKLLPPLLCVIVKVQRLAFPLRFGNQPGSLM